MIWFSTRCLFCRAKLEGSQANRGAQETKHQTSLCSSIGRPCGRQRRRFGRLTCHEVSVRIVAAHGVVVSIDLIAQVVRTVTATVHCACQNPTMRMSETHGTAHCCASLPVRSGAGLGNTPSRFFRVCGLLANDPLLNNLTVEGLLGQPVVGCVVLLCNEEGD